MASDWPSAIGRWRVFKPRSTPTASSRRPSAAGWCRVARPTPPASAAVSSRTLPDPNIAIVLAHQIPPAIGEAHRLGTLRDVRIARQAGIGAAGGLTDPPAAHLHSRRAPRERDDQEDEQGNPEQ